MALERYWEAVPPVALTSPGSTQGRVNVTSTRGFYVKAIVILQDPSLPQLRLEVKRVLSPTSMELGPAEQPISARIDLSAYGPAGPSVVYAFEQDKRLPSPKEMTLATYAQEPACALRALGVDQFGRPYSLDNPLPVQLSDGSIKIGTVNAELEVQLSAKDNDPTLGDVHDSVRIGDGSYELGVNPDKSINVNMVDSAPAWDDLILTRDPVTQDITTATYKLGGSTVKTLTMTYDADENLVEVIRT